MKALLLPDIELFLPISVVQDKRLKGVQSKLLDNRIMWERLPAAIWFFQDINQDSTVAARCRSHNETNRNPTL